MKLTPGERVAVRGFNGRLRYEGVVDEDPFLEDGRVRVVPDGEGRARAVDVAKVRRLALGRLASAPPPLERPPVRSAELRAVPKPAPPARDSEYLAFVRSHPCCACHTRDGVEAHHWAPRGDTGGMGRKPSDKRTVPLCETCHRAMHDTGELPHLKATSDKKPCPTCGRKRSGAVASRFLILATQLRLRDAWDAREGCA